MNPNAVGLDPESSFRNGYPMTMASGVVTQHSSVKVAAGPRTNFSRDLADPAPSLRSPALDLDPDTSFEDVRVGRNPCRLRRGAIATTSVMRMLRLRTSDVPR
jgi:hypothetical protein